MAEKTAKLDTFDLFKARWKLASEAEKDQRQREIEDLEFEAGQHWDPRIQADREKDGKPCLTIDLLSGLIKPVLNMQRTARPGAKISGVSGSADQKKADVRQGIVRRVERLSKAGRIYTWAGQHQIKMGRGCWVVRNQYVGSGEEQDIRIEEVDNQHTVYVDPTCKKLDGSDKKWAIRFEDLTHEEYKDRFGDSDMADSLTSDSWQTIGDAPPEWITSSHCRIAEYYYLEQEAVKTVGKRKVTRNRVQWCLLNGAGEVLDSATIPGQFIPVVTIYGERRNIDGKVDYRGMVRMAKDPSRMEDFCESSLMETISLAKTAPWIMASTQAEGHESMWSSSNRVNYASLFYKPVAGPGGQLLPPPQRVTAGVDVTALTLAAQRMQNHIRTVAGRPDTYQDETASQQSKLSGKAINFRRQEQELGTSDYMENLGDGIMLTARIILSMAPEVYDTPRIMRIVGDDEKERTIVTHMGPEQMDAARGMLTEDHDGIYDLSDDDEDYDIDISPGKRHDTARQESVEILGGLIPNLPPQMQAPAIVALVKNMDGAGMAELAAKFEPPADGEQDKASLMQQVQQMGQQLKQAMQYIQTEQAKYQGQIEVEKVKQQADVQMEGVKQQAQVAVEQAKFQMQVELQKMKDATTIRVAEINALTKGVIADHGAEHEAIALAHSQEHASSEADAARQHEAQQAEAEHARGLEQTDQQGLQSALLADQGQGHAREQAQMGHQQAIEQAEVGHAQALEQSEVGHRQTLEQTTHAAKVAPKPAKGKA